MSRYKAVLILAVLFVVAASSSAQTTTEPESALSEKSPSELLKCFSSAEKCGAESDWDIADQLGKARNLSFLLSAFNTANDENERHGIIYSLYRIDAPEVAAFYKRLVAEHFDDGEELYYPLNYLAKRCDRDALGVLSGNGKGGYKGYPGCQQWATTVELFGKCKYKPAVPYLIQSINAACMNIGIAAVESLEQIYPGAPDFTDHSSTQIEGYFRGRAAADSKRVSKR